MRAYLPVNVGLTKNCKNIHPIIVSPAPDGLVKSYALSVKIHQKLEMHAYNLPYGTKSLKGWWRSKKAVTYTYNRSIYFSSNGHKCVRIFDLVVKHHYKISTRQWKNKMFLRCFKGLRETGKLWTKEQLRINRLSKGCL